MYHRARKLAAASLVVMALTLCGVAGGGHFHAIKLVRIAIFWGGDFGMEGVEGAAVAVAVFFAGVDLNVAVRSGLGVVDAVVAAGDEDGDFGAGHGHDDPPYFRASANGEGDRDRPAVVVEG